MNKTQHQIENEYAFVDLPELLLMKNERRAKELFELVEVASFPHNTDKRSREAYLNRLRSQLPQEPPAPPKSVEEQYQAQVLRMKGG